MLRYKIMYLWFRLWKHTPSQARGKIARWITRDVKTSIEETLEEINR